MSKINQILAKWLPGDVHTLRWFESHDISQRAAYGYSETGATRKIGPGVFALPEYKLSWLGAVRAMQDELKLPVHVGYRTALELQGASHNMVQTTNPIIKLVMSKKMRIPSWIKENDWHADLDFSSSTLFDGDQEVTDFTSNGITVKIATREQAILEFINDLDLGRNFDAAENQMSTLMTLRPKTVQDLMSRCSSTKVKRVFLYLAETLELPFFAKLDLNKIDLGSGKRVLVKGGRLDPKYQITVPRTEGEGSRDF